MEPNILELKYHGNEISPSKVKPSEIAHLIISFEKALLGTIKQRHPEIDTNAILFSYHKIDDKSLDLQFRPELAPEQVNESYQALSNSIKENDFDGLTTSTLEHLKELTKFSTKHDCVGQFNEDGKTLSTFLPNTKIKQSLNNQLWGETTIYGTVLRTGGEKPTIHFKVDNDYRIIFDTSEDFARRLGSRLYERIGLKGKAKWNVKSFEVLDFKISDIIEQEIKPVKDAFKDLRDLIGKYWDKVDDINSIVG